MPEGRLRLHLDADASRKALHRALCERGHDVTRTPNAWMTLDASDIEQILGATNQGRAIFTFNIRDFSVLAKRYPQHQGIILAAQSRWSPSQLIRSLHDLLSSTRENELAGQLIWLPRSS